MDGITIRPARPDDAKGIAGLDVDTWRSTYAGILSASYLSSMSVRRREFGWRGVIQREPRDVRVAADPRGGVIGFGSCGSCRAEHDCSGEVFTLYVAQDWQNQGVGRGLLLALLGRLLACGNGAAIVWVLQDNPARFFYQRLGGKQVGRKFCTVGGKTVEAAAYAWRDLRSFLAAALGNNRRSQPGSEP